MPAVVVKEQSDAEPGGGGSGRRRRSAAASATVDGAEAEAEAGTEGAAAGDAEGSRGEGADRVDDGIVTNLRPHFSYISGLRCGSACVISHYSDLETSLGCIENFNRNFHLNHFQKGFYFFQVLLI